MTTNSKLHKVAACSAADYAPQNVQRAVDSVLADLGGIEQFVPQNAKVFVKVNLVREMTPDKCGTVHPEVVVALCNRLAKITPNVTVGDSSAGLFTKSVMNGVYNKCQMMQVPLRTNAQLNYDFGSSQVAVNGVATQQLQIIDAFLKADVVINVTKLKTHSFAGYTGAVKNLYGLIPGLVKVEMHSRYPDLGDFCNLLCDIEQFASSKITLHLVDGIFGMDGDGPTNGNPKFLGQILAGANPYAVDYVAVSLFAKNPMDMPLLQTACNRGLIFADGSQIDFDFFAWKQHFVGDFDAPTVTDTNTFLNMPKWVKRLAKKHMTKKVKIAADICKGCGKCATHCPNKAITLKNGKAKVSQQKCIRCYCCQELCPFNAVKFRKPLLYKIMHKLSGTSNKK